MLQKVTKNIISFKQLILIAAVMLISLSLHAQRSNVPLQGTFNFRDIGGYPAFGGKHIKWGKIYRSALLSNLTQEDLALLEAFKICKVIDFRGPLEIKAYPDKLPHTATYYDLPAGSETDTPDDWASLAKDMLTSPVPKSDSGTIAYYEDISYYARKYRPMFDLLLSTASDSAVVIHCAGGKDRTGVAAALIEYALGVDRKDIIKDYMLTNRFRSQYNEEIAQLLHYKYGVPLERARTYGLAQAASLEATLHEIEKQYGSLDNFLLKAIGLDSLKIKKLRTLYLD